MRKKATRALSWILTIIWMIFIFSMSAKPGTESNGLSMAIAETVIKIIGIVYPLNAGNITDHQSLLNGINFVVRKCAHASAYFILALLSFNAFRRSGFKGSKAFLAALGLCVLYSISDELHQLFVPGRSCELRDMGIDSSGALLGCLLYSLLSLPARAKIRLSRSRNS